MQGIATGARTNAIREDGSSTSGAGDADNVWSSNVKSTTSEKYSLTGSYAGADYDGGGLTALLSTTTLASLDANGLGNALADGDTLSITIDETIHTFTIGAVNNGTTVGSLVNWINEIDGGASVSAEITDSGHLKIESLGEKITLTSNGAADGGT